MNNSFDPTKATYLEPPENQTNYELSSTVWDTHFIWSQNVQHFTSLLCHWILNVSQVLKKWQDNVSIPIREELIEEKLSFQEILADIVLYQLITWDWDRDLLPMSWKNTWWKIQLHNCLIFNWWNYSIFDIYDYCEIVEEDEVLRKIIHNIRLLHDNKYLDDPDFFDWLFLSPEENDYINTWKQWFFQRMQSKIEEFLVRYDWEEWKTFFIMQKQYSCPDEDMKSIIERYEELIYTLKNIKKVISQANIREIALKKVWEDYLLVKEDLKLHLTKVFKLFWQLLNILKSKIRIF